MNVREARKLHNGDEVVLKTTGETIKVLSVNHRPYGYGTNERKGTPIVEIEGVGDMSGHAVWLHDEVR